MSSEYKLARESAEELVEPWISRDERRAPGSLPLLLVEIRSRIFEVGVKSETLWDGSGLIEEDHEASFAAVFGVSPIAYLKELRWRAALELMGNSDFRPITISRALGFRSWSTMYKAFIRKLDMTPKVYRQTERERAKKLRALSRELGERHHKEGKRLFLLGSTDDAYQHLVTAQSSYINAGLSSAELVQCGDAMGISVETRQAFLLELCRRCRALLQSEKGESVRHALGNAMGWIPSKAPWFQECCGSCYRRFWAAIRKAQIALTADAWKACWLHENTCMTGNMSPSMGRFIGMMVEVEECARTVTRIDSAVDLCGSALAEATAIGEVLPAVLPRIWEGVLLSYLGHNSDGRIILESVESASAESPFLEALRWNHLGFVEYRSSRYEDSVRAFRTGEAIYRRLDPHWAGKSLILEGGAHLELGAFEETLALNREAKLLLDGRREPIYLGCVIPVNLAKTLALLDRMEEACTELARANFDRSRYRDYFAMEITAEGCIALLRRKFEHALRKWEEARAIFESLNCIREVAVGLSYSVEAHWELGDFDAGLRALTEASELFAAIDAGRETLLALSKLRELIVSKSREQNAVIEIIRVVGKANGGWLPVEGPEA